MRKEGKENLSYYLFQWVRPLLCRSTKKIHGRSGTRRDDGGDGGGGALKEPDYFLPPK